MSRARGCDVVIQSILLKVGNFWVPDDFIFKAESDPFSSRREDPSASPLCGNRQDTKCLALILNSTIAIEES